MPPRPDVARLVLGTAQLGLTYGIANTTVLDADGKQALLREAVSRGVTWLDTARAYGDSEAVIGRFLALGAPGTCNIVTKLAPLADMAHDANPAAVMDAVDRSLDQSRAALGLPRLQTVLLHRASHLRAWGGAVWSRLQGAVKRGVVTEIGVSVQNPDELEQALETEALSHIQLPFNLLDWRWDKCLEPLRQARRSRRIVVHVRSILLQGLLVTDRPAAWQCAGIDDGVAVRRWLVAQAEQHGLGGDVARLCMAFANGQDWIDGLVVGTDNVRQLHDNIAAIEHRLSAAAIDDIVAARPVLAAFALDPAQWRRCA